MRGLLPKPGVVNPDRLDQRQDPGGQGLRGGELMDAHAVQKTDPDPLPGQEDKAAVLGVGKGLLVPE